LFNDERGTGGHSRLARLLDWDYSTLRRKHSRKGQITQSDELAIEEAAYRLLTGRAYLRPAEQSEGASREDDRTSARSSRPVRR
jgi:hypothetical protein